MIPLEYGCGCGMTSRFQSADTVKKLPKDGFLLGRLHIYQPSQFHVSALGGFGEKSQWQHHHH